MISYIFQTHLALESTISNTCYTDATLESTIPVACHADVSHTDCGCSGVGDGFDLEVHHV